MPKHQAPSAALIAPEPVVAPVEPVLRLDVWYDEDGRRYRAEARGGFAFDAAVKGWTHATAREWQARMEAWLRSPA